MDITFAITAVGAFNICYTELFANVIPDQPFEPVAGVDDNRLLIVVFRCNGVEVGRHVGEGLGEWKRVADNLIEAIFRRYENRLRCAGGDGRFAYPFASVNQNAWRFRAFAAVDTL